MSTKVSPFMGGLGRDVTSKFTITDDASVTVGDGTNGGNVAVGDNGVISFGAGNDLQIWHSGTSSYIKDAGTGNLNIQAENLVIENTSGTDYITGINGGAVTIFNNGSPKFATTTTGVNVTGDVGGDTLTVSGDGTISGDVTLGTNSSNTILITGSIDLGTL